MSPKVEIWCSLPATRGKEARLRQILVDLANRVVVEEKGCETYLVLESEKNGDVLFNIFERWEAQADLDQHTNRPWLQAIRQAFDEEDLIVGGEVINPVSVISGFTDRKIL